jgi:hypothetical protein
VRWDLTAEQVAAVERGPVHLVVDHPAYTEAAELASSTVGELLLDLHG